MLILLAGLMEAQKSVSDFRLAVEDLPAGGTIPARFSCDGAGVSPALRWSGEPAGTQSFALIMDDPDARDFVHWLLWDIPASAHTLPEGAKSDGIPGANSFGDRGYGGPCPPRGAGAHTYVFRLFALDLPSAGVKTGKGRNTLEQAIKKHVLARAEYRLKFGH
jgi:Raf kinase inhibitor-like YbhB/YbcL family protein